MRRSDKILAAGSLFVGVLAALAGLVLVVAAINLNDDLRHFSDGMRTQTIAAKAVVLSLAAFCFFEAYQFLAFRSVFQNQGPLLRSLEIAPH
jgi:hypothetical protein